MRGELDELLSGLDIEVCDVKQAPRVALIRRQELYVIAQVWDVDGVPVWYLTRSQGFASWSEKETCVFTLDDAIAAALILDDPSCVIRKVE